jgi:hypothetical protein
MVVGISRCVIYKLQSLRKCWFRRQYEKVVAVESWMLIVCNWWLGQEPSTCAPQSPFCAVSLMLPAQEPPYSVLLRPPSSIPPSQCDPMNATEGILYRKIRRRVEL